MKIDSQLADEAILLELGSRLTSERLAKNLTQAALAAEAGVSKRTIERLESGAVATHLSAFIRVCRALGLAERFELLVPSPTISPMEQLKFRGRQRQRASGARVAERTQKKWTWGESE